MLTYLTDLIIVLICVNYILSSVPYTFLLDSALLLLVVLLFAIFYLSCVILSHVVVEYSSKLSLTLSIIFCYVVRPHHYIGTVGRILTSSVYF